MVGDWQDRLKEQNMADQKKKNQQPINDQLTLAIEEHELTLALKDGIEALENRAGRLEWDAENHRNSIRTLVESDLEQGALNVGLEALDYRAEVLEFEAMDHRKALKVFEAKLAALQNPQPAQVTDQV
jgi:hypothetical protein